MSKINVEHEDAAQVKIESLDEAIKDQEEQDSQISPYGTPDEPAEEQELNFGD